MKVDLKQALNEHRPIILDGATGSNLMIAGMPKSVCPEIWLMENEAVLIDLQREYVENGSDIVFAPTFGANRTSLKRYSLDDRIIEINKRLVEISKKAVGNDALIFADISPSGLFMKPYGEATFDEVYNVFHEQAQILEDCGVDGFIIETQINLAETRAAVLAVKAVSNKPVFATMSVDAQGKTMSGNALGACAVALEALGIDVFGCNCSVGPADMLKVLELVRKEYTSLPLIAKANAGNPHGEGCDMHFDVDSDEFADVAEKLFNSGVQIIGGCCGSTPEYIAKIKNKLQGKKVQYKEINTEYCVCDEKIVYFADVLSDLPPVIECSPDLEDDIMEALDNEQEVFRLKVNTLADADLLLDASYLLKMPLMLSCNNADVLERTLKLYAGRAIIEQTANLSDDEKEHIKRKYNPLFM